MIGDPFTMVVAIIAIITVGKVMSVRFKSKNGIIEDEYGNQKQIKSDSDSARMREEIAALKDRIQVLERIATDNNNANDIGRQIEQLRDR
jgi:hypothetical protein